MENQLYLDISFGLVCDLHQELRLAVNHMLQDLLVNAVIHDDAW
jgi:hypothetical protein